MQPSEVLIPGAAILLGLIIILLIPRSFKAWLWTLVWVIIGYLAATTPLVDELSDLLETQSIAKKGFLVETGIVLTIMLVMMLDMNLNYGRI